MGGEITLEMRIYLDMKDNENTKRIKEKYQ